MATSKLFQKVPTVVPGRSGFNLSHSRYFSAPVGTLVPSMVDFLIPGDEIDLSSQLEVQLPPMATDFYGRIQAREEAFFVPFRTIFGGWKDFFVNPADGVTNPSNVDGQLAKYLIGAKVPLSATGTLTDDDDTNPTYQDVNLGSVLDDNDEFVKDEFISQVSAAVKRTAELYLSGVQSNNYYILEDNSDLPVGPGSLSDYLGFKVAGKPTAINKSDIDSLNEDIASSWLDGSTLVATTAWYVLSGGETSYTDKKISIGDSSEFDISLNIVVDSNSELIKVYITNGFDGDETIDIPNIGAHLAYHKIYDDWYREPMIQTGLFKRKVANQSVATSVANMPWITSGAEEKIYFEGDQLNFANGHNLFDLHQRNWTRDYFTSMTPEPQAGDASKVSFDVVDEKGEFTIAALRGANAIQQWLDKQNLCGFRYGDYTYALYGVYPSDAITDRAIFLGSATYDIYNKSVYQTAQYDQNSNNPFNAIGSKYSTPMGVGNGSYCNNYRVTEAGFVIKIFSLVPEAYYSTGSRRFFQYSEIADIANFALAGVGDQEVKAYEIVDNYTGAGDDTTIGYAQRFAEYKFIDSSVHGLLRDGQSLSSFALQRSFNEAPELSSEFLQIPRDYLDQVSAADYQLSKYGCWVNMFNTYKKSSTLPAYSLPTLEDLKGYTVVVDKGGSRL